MTHISALSPSLKPVFIILVYPPGLEAIFSDILLNSSVTDSLLLSREKTVLLE